MTEKKFTTALIVGAGAGLSASLARVLSKEGIKVALAARTTDDLNDLAVESRRARRSRATRPSAPTSTSCSPISTPPSARPRS